VVGGFGPGVGVLHEGQAAVGVLEAAETTRSARQSSIAFWGARS
jgi:hypothetical protein